MDDKAKARLAENVSNLPKMLSAWAMGLAGLLGAIWFALPPEQQMQILVNSPLPPWSYPIVLTSIGVLARVWPQKSLSPPDDEEDPPANDPERTEP